MKRSILETGSAGRIARRAFLGGLTAIGLLAGIAQVSAAEPFKIGANPGPTGQIADFVAKLARSKGFDVKVVEFSDWVTINAAVDSGDIDLNLFQHKPFLAAAIKARGFKLVPVGPVAVMPVGLYSRKVKSADEVQSGATVAIANDPVNAARGLRLFQKLGLIKLKPGAGDDATLADIVDNPKKLRFVEIEAPQLTRILDDVAIAQQSTTFLLASGGDLKSALVTDGEGDDYYALEYVARADRAGDERVRRFVEIAHSAEVRDFIAQQFKGVITPAWN